MHPVCRFCPTQNGNLHLGHVFSLLINEGFAHEYGGKFIIRFDDSSPTVVALPPDKLKLIMDNQQKDIEWLDIKVDEWEWQSKLTTRAQMFLDAHDYIKLPEELEPELPVFTRMNNTNWLPFPYMPHQTAERVVMDNWSGITHLIRGEEFSTEYSLYCYYCQLFAFTPPHFILLPRLMGKYGDISKTNGGYTIAEFRGQGYTAHKLKDMLTRSCLTWHRSGWNFYNLKSNPRIDL